MDIVFHGAAGEVTGSCHLVEVAGKRVLLDCGMVQGERQGQPNRPQGESGADERNAADFPFDPKSIDVLVLSHAHIDHTGRVPLLVKRGFAGPIHTHPATIDLAAIMLADSASIAAMDAEWDNRNLRPGQKPVVPLYTQDDVEAAGKSMRPVGYGAPQEILPGITLTLRDAGHILGSASVELAAREGGSTRKLAFSGDLGPTHTPILCDPAPVPDANLVVMESTYGDRLHRSREDTITELASIFAAAHKDGGNVVIPAFAVGRTQELLYFFAEHFDAWNLGAFRMFLDSPMAIRVTDAYDRHEGLFDRAAKKLWDTRPRPLRLPNLTFSADGADSRKINAIHHHAVIIAGSGMCTGGRIRHHLRHNLANPAAHIVFVGYQANGTLGRIIVDGAKQVRLFGDEIPVRARVHTVGGLSAHADRDGLADWYGRIAGHPPVCLVHGEDPGRAKLADELEARWGSRVTLPMPGTRVTV
ncbi:MAG TPA: MBL fold metallo-hydrolase [Rhodanobacteraceae bacterium]|nr:MBL fold metallo-hydrolase [Rhodanobacteraceae bacterium]